jgi:ABC-2 type transport system permease protein
MSASTPASFPHALRLLLRIQLKRLARQLSAGFRVFSRKPAEGKREATAPKSKGGLVIGAALGVLMFFGFMSIAVQSVTNIKQHGDILITENAGETTAALPPPGAQYSKEGPVEEIPPVAYQPSASGVVRIAAFVTLVLLATITLFSIGNGELARPDWDLEWLATLPISTPALIHTRIITRTLLNPTGFVFLAPFLCALAWEAWSFGAAVLLGVAATLMLLAVAATLQTLCDTGLKLRLSPAQLRNLQAAISILGVIGLYLGLSPGIGSGGGGTLIIGWAASMPQWLMWTPPGLAAQALTTGSAADVAFYLALLVAQVAAIASLGAAVLNRELRHGVVAGGGRESARPARTQVPPRRRTAGNRLILTAVQARELRLLARDRTFLVQTLVLPVIMIGAQIAFNASGEALFASVGERPELVATIAFGIAAYALMFSAFQTLNSEGQALWILYSVPQSLETTLRQKALLWGALCLVYPAAMFGYVLATQPEIPPRLGELGAFVLLGIPVLATIATALGVFACDPLSPTPQRRVKLSYSYLYFLISSIYGYALYADSFWQRATLLTLTAALALALWQKARDRLPFVLDPVASPPQRVSLSDGLIAAQVFFVIQAILVALITRDGRQLTGGDLLIAFSAAGGVTFLVMRFAFWRLKSEGIPRVFGRGTIGATGIGILGGLAAAGIAYVYLFLTPLPSYFEQPTETLLARGGKDLLMLALLAVAAAPLFEEFIFRGLIYGGLRRSMGVSGSVLASAALFAIVHPPVGFLPVFVLGIGAALVYERTRLLIGPIAVHAAYNACIVGFQALNLSQ